MRMALIAFTIQPGLLAIRHKHCVFPDASVLLFCSVPALIQLGDMQTQSDKYLEKAFFDDLKGTTVLNDKMVSHQDLQKAEQCQELKSWLFFITTGC